MPTKTKEEQNDITQVVLDEKKYYEESSQKQRDTWEELWKLYLGALPESKHKSLSRNFIPKTHQAVETMASFLAGNDPTIICLPVGAEDDDKARFMGRLLEFQWQYEIKMKPKVLTWVKSGILFGVGIMKAGWDAEKDAPFVYPVDIGNFFTDVFVRDVQEGHSTIERIVDTIANVKKRFPKTAKDLKPIETTTTGKKDGTIFDSHDLDPQTPSVIDRVELLERWTMDEVVTVAIQQTAGKQSALRLERKKNPYGFIPYVPFFFKDGPLPNRFYNMGMVEPVMPIQKRINQVVNQMIDNVNLVMSPQAILRRGSGIDPRQIGSLIPGQTILANRPMEDIQWREVPDTTPTGFNLLSFLNVEFQSGTSVTDIRLGQTSGASATEAKIQQANLNIQTSLVKENLEHSISLLGQMLAKLNIKYINSARAMRIFDPEDVWEFETMMGSRRKDSVTGLPLEMTPQERLDIQKVGRVFHFDKGDLDGEYDIRIKADSTILQNRDILRKSLIDFSQFLASLGVQIDTKEIAKFWGDLSGIPNAARFVKKEPPVMMGPKVGPGGGQSLAPPSPNPTPSQTSVGLTDNGQEQAANPPSAMTQ